MRALRKKIVKEVADADGETVRAAALAIIPHSRFFAYELVCDHDGAMQSINRKDVEKLASGMASWSAVDTFACCISGRAWREGCITDAVIREWAKSEDRWWRRAALVSTVPLNIAAQGGLGDSKRTRAVCKLLIHDRDDMVVKALSWALRALVKHDPAGVRQFLSDHRSELAARVVREVNHKLTTGLKNPRGRKSVRM